MWVGFDSRESLGEKETGARAALPIWIAVMKQAILAKPDEHFLGDDAPENDTTVKAPARPAAPTAKPTRQ